MSGFHWQETNAVHVNVGAGSYLEINIPMTIAEHGELKAKMLLVSQGKKSGKKSKVSSSYVLRHGSVSLSVGTGSSHVTRSIQGISSVQ